MMVRMVDIETRLAEAEAEIAALTAGTHPALDPEYADVDEDGQLALGVAGDQRAIPGLAQARVTEESIAQDKARSPFFAADDYR